MNVPKKKYNANDLFALDTSIKIKLTKAKNKCGYAKKKFKIAIKS
jgi:hypothetical protein